MKRLTEKILKDELDDFDYDHYKTIHEDECVHKLGQLEDIEEELGGGVELSVLLNNGLKNGVYLKDLRDYEPITFVRAITLGYYKRWILEYDYFIYNVKDYGKTWAFTKEELERN